MNRFPRATAADLPTLARIHKTAYSRSHFTALLPDKVLMRYYVNFFNEGSEIWLALDDAVNFKEVVIPVEGVLGFAVFGFRIPEKIARFKQECRLDIFYTSLLHPWRASKKVFGGLISKLENKKAFTPTDFLLLSIAVARPGCGVGRSLLNAMIEIAKQQECKAVGLYVNSDNVGAINVYFSMGFVISHFQGRQFYMEKKL